MESSAIIAAAIVGSESAISTLCYRVGGTVYYDAVWAAESAISCWCKLCLSFQIKNLLTALY